MSNLYAIYFSATGTTQHCVESFCQGFGTRPTKTINLVNGFDVQFPEVAADDVVIVAAPVYGGRIPAQVADALAGIKGFGAIAIAFVVYGNRDFDDALLEITDILHDNDFKIVGAGAFIGQHSIFTKVASSRPDLSDENQLIKFGIECKNTIRNGFDTTQVPYIKGNRPYKKFGGVPFHPKAKEADCQQCGNCVEVCPEGAIPADKPFTVDADKCISCGRCITVCSQGVRKYSGIGYSAMELTFSAAFSKRKEPQWVVAK